MADSLDIRYDNMCFLQYVFVSFHENQSVFNVCISHTHNVITSQSVQINVLNRQLSVGTAISCPVNKVLTKIFVQRSKVSHLFNISLIE